MKCEEIDKREAYNRLMEIWQQIPEPMIIDNKIHDLSKTKFSILKESLSGIVIRNYKAYDEKEMNEWLYGKLEAWVLQYFSEYNSQTYDDGFAIGVYRP